MLPRFARGSGERRLLNLPGRQKMNFHFESADGLEQVVLLLSGVFLLFAAFFKDLLSSAEEFPCLGAELLGSQVILLGQLASEDALLTVPKQPWSWTSA